MSGIIRHAGLDPASTFFFHWCFKKGGPMIGSPNELSEGQLIPIIKSGVTDIAA
jgi:hypothetical protein